MAGLRLFFTYGLANSKPQIGLRVVDQKEKESNLLSSNQSSNGIKKVDPKPYRPPHLRSKDTINRRKIKHSGSTSKTVSDQESPGTYHLSSDSDYSDSDSSTRDADSMVRVAALLCVQVRLTIFLIFERLNFPSYIFDKEEYLYIYARVVASRF